MLTLWGRLNSVNVQKVVFAIDELGLACTRIDAGLAYGVVDTPQYRAMNPNGLVPTLDDDGFVLWESNTIVRYLAAKHGGGLLPADMRDRFRAEAWMDWQGSGFGPAITPAFYNLVRVAPEKRDMAAVEASRKACERWLGALDAGLAGRAWLAGDAFSMADIPAGVTANRWYKLPLARETHANVEAWLARLRERPAFRQFAEAPLS